MIDIPWNSMVCREQPVTTFQKPCTNLTDTIMLPVEKLNLDGLQLRTIRCFDVIRQTVKVSVLWRRPQ